MRLTLSIQCSVTSELRHPYLFLLRSYFSKSLCIIETIQVNERNEITNTTTPKSTEQQSSVSEIVASPSVTPEPTTTKRLAAVNQFGISFFVNKSTADIIESCIKLQNKIWIPPSNYEFPASEQRNLKFQCAWLQKYTWLAYSGKEDGAFCKCCVLFGVREGGANKKILGQLVLIPFRNWKNALEAFNKHQSTDYHKKALLQSTMRASIDQEKNLPIDLQLSQQKLDFIAKSKTFLVPIIDTIILCGRQGIALRGSEENGRITSSEPLNNDGNFRSLLRYRAKGDVELKKHLESSSKNATYTSPRIQNELIFICFSLIQKQIIEKVNRSQAFSILADETSDISGVEQMSMCVRYLDTDEGTHKICESFLTFTPVTDFSGKGLAETLINFLESSGIDLTYLVGQGYDGARSMSGEFHGAQSYVKDKYPLANYSHCASHSFNLAVNDACKSNEIKNCIGTIKSVYGFFKYPKRQLALQKAIDAEQNLTKNKKLKSHCATRWVEQHEAVATYLYLQPAVISALQNISATWRDSTASEAFQLMSAIKTLVFQV